MNFDRRTFLRGVGVGVALPAMESLLPGGKALAKAAAESAGQGGLALTESGMPLRTAFLYRPNGVNLDHWTLDATGRDFTLDRTHAPYAKFKDQLHILGKLEHKNGTSGGDGGGDHARANASFLTGVRPYKTAGADIKLGVSVDQVIARKIGDQTRLSSLELSCDGVRKSGVCDSGYSCAYQFNLSWRGESTPMTPEANPRLVFERLFGAGSKEERQRGFEMRQRQGRSLLDFVMEDAKSLERQLGSNDKHKLDEYLTGVREIEKRIEKEQRFGLPEDPGVSAPEGIPGSHRDHIRLMMDMLALAFETDSTRVATFMLAYDGSNRSFREIGVPDGHHAVSHHRKDKEKLEKLAKIDRFYSEQFAYFLEKLSEKKDADGKSVLHNSQIVFGGGLSDPDRHNHSNLPIVVAGRGGGKLKTGLHTELGSDTPVCNLYLSLMDQIGVREERFGDSTGRVGAIV